MHCFAVPCSAFSNITIDSLEIHPTLEAGLQPCTTGLKSLLLTGTTTVLITTGTDKICDVVHQRLHVED